MQLACSSERHHSSHETINSRASPGLLRIAFGGAGGHRAAAAQYGGGAARYAGHFSCRTRSKRLSVMEATNRGHSPCRLEISALNAVHGALVPALPPPMMQRSSTRPAHVNTLGSSRNGSSCSDHQPTACCHTAAQASATQTQHRASKRRTTSARRAAGTPQILHL
jgi:hypothetical protein